MLCPMCQKVMTFHYKTLADKVIPGYTDTLTCTACDCIVELKVMVHHKLHNIINGKPEEE